MKVGDKVIYEPDPSFEGTVLQINQTLCRVIWYSNETIEWVPLYSLKVIKEYKE